MAANYFSELSGRVCVITGGGGVIGSSLTRGLAQAGMRIAILDIDGSLAERVAAEIGEKTGARLMGLRTDVLDRESLESARDRIRKELGKITYLINGAGGNSPRATTGNETMRKQEPEWEKSFFGLEPDGFDSVYALNFKGTLLPTMVFAKDMVENGSGAIVNISSMAAFKSLTKVPAYSAAKASVNNFTEWLSVHLASTGVRVNAIAPGFFLTSQNRFLLTDERTGKLTPRGKKIIENTPMGHFGDVDDLQGTVLFLLSDMSRFITGIIIPVDGGFNAYGGV